MDEPHEGAVTAGPGQIYIAAAPTCPRHKGPLSFSIQADRWMCHGWDGEGCGWTRPPDWTYLGTTAEPLTIAPTLGPGEQWAEPREEYL